MKLPADEPASVFDTLRITLQPPPLADPAEEMNNNGVDQTSLLTSAVHTVSTTLLSTTIKATTTVQKAMNISSAVATKLASSISLLPSPSPSPSTSSSSLFFHKHLNSVNVTATKVVSEVKDSLTEMFTNPAVASPDDVGGGGIVNTPLTAPEASLATLTQPLLGSSSDLKDLGWIIPVVIVIIVAMVGLAFAFYFGVVKLEMRMLGWCYRNCGCCCKPGVGEGGRLLSGERYATLKEQGPSDADRRDSVRMRDFRERSTSYGERRNTSHEYTPRRAFNPFDED